MSVLRGSIFAILVIIILPTKHSECLSGHLDCETPVRCMISGTFLINQRGDVVLSRFYRDNATRRAADGFRRKIIAAKETGSLPPIQCIDGCSFMYIRHENMYLVGVSRSNCNAALAFEFLFQLNRIFQVYLGKSYSEDSIRNNFTLVYELLEETMDFGYPQNCTVDVLRMYVNLGTFDATAERSVTQLTSQITGAIDWRREGIRYKRNEVFIDVLESVNLLISADGTILRNDVSGQVMMKALLSGMPECKFGLNDKLKVENDGKKRLAKSVEIDDCTFHRCVRLGKFDSDRTITFVPPDGEFELMRYRITDNIHLPFKIISAIQEVGKTRVAINLKIAAAFNRRLSANNVVIKIPVR